MIPTEHQQKFEVTVMEKDSGLSSIGKLKNIRLASTLGLAAFATSLPAQNKSVLDLQPAKVEQILDITTDQGGKIGFVRLINLNSEVNIWYILAIAWPGTTTSISYHLENPNPKSVKIQLDATFKKGLRLVRGNQAMQCQLWPDLAGSEIESAVRSAKSYAPICNGQLMIRNQTKGNETTKEYVADLLRKHVWGGEQLTSLVKDYLFKDKFLINSEITTEAKASTQAALPARPEKPTSAILNPDFIGKSITPQEMGIDLGAQNNTPLAVGQWVEVKNHDGIFFSAIEPKSVDKEILKSYGKIAKPLDEVEDSAVVYLVAYDLDRYDLGFVMGTAHPSTEWSDRTREEMRNKDLSGPDGFDKLDPLIMSGKVSPYDASKVVSTFTGGFKRSHSAFKWGKHSTINGGSHYGFMENGIVLSTLQPDLATLIVNNDGSIEMKSWTEQDNLRIPKILHARQNGVPIVEWDQSEQRTKPGDLVGSWNDGNWSGSQASKQRALRAGVCLQEHHGKQFLIYAYFSSATANAMARVFQAYTCRYAMHLDMNALEHTYLAIYERNEQDMEIQHLIRGMNVLDRKEKGQIVPRFVGTADNRDFFYLIKK